jgi:hypothetical protein
MIQFYKPNPSVKGSACSFWMTDDKALMSSFIKQDSWDSARKRGSFSKNKDNPRAKALVKYSQVEAAGLIDAIERNTTWSAYHSSKNQIIKIIFGPYMDKKTGEQKGFSYGVNKEAKEDSTDRIGFIIGLTFPEARLLKEFLSGLLQKTFENSAMFADNNKKPAPAQPSGPPRRGQEGQEGQEDDEDEIW